MKDGNASASSDEFAVPAIPEDVAILYSWANLPGARYRDFSASRREHRAQQRARYADDQRLAELASARTLEEAARQNMEEAKQAFDFARHEELQTADAGSRAHAEEAFRLAEINAEREQGEVARRHQSAETLRLRAQAARNEMMEARKRAEEQAARYAEFDAQYRAQMQERGGDLPGQLEDPYYYTGQVDPAYFASTPGVRTAQAARTSTERKGYVFPSAPGSSDYDSNTLREYRPSTTFAPSPAQNYLNLSPVRRVTSPQLFDGEVRPARDHEESQSAAADWEYSYDRERDLPSHSLYAVAPVGLYATESDLNLRPRAPDPQEREHDESAASTKHRFDVDTAPLRPFDGRGRREGNADLRARTIRHQRPDDWSAETAPPESAENTANVPPAWLAYHEPHDASRDPAPSSPYPPVRGEQSTLANLSVSEQRLQRFSEASDHPRSLIEGDAEIERDDENAPGFGPAAARDTLQGSREHVASRWFALRGLMDFQPEAEPSPLPPYTSHVPTVPMLVVLGLSGGVGRTSMVATLGRTLSSIGETVLLADANTHGLLPYYFGARDLRPGAVRTFTPPPGSRDAPILMAHYDLERVGENTAAQEKLVADLLERSAAAQRTLIDLGSGGMWLVRRLVPLRPFLLVPLKPDMNSVLSMQALEQLLSEIEDPEGKPLRPFYILNQYDSALPLHLDVREVLRQSLGHRLLAATMHRTPAVSEALAEGMTVLDYAHDSTIAEDYGRLAEWVQSVGGAGTSEMQSTRWSER